MAEPKCHQEGNFTRKSEVLSNFYDFANDDKPRKYVPTKVLFSLFLHSKLPVAVSIKSTLSISHAITAVKASSEQVSEEGEIAQTDNIGNSTKQRNV